MSRRRTAVASDVVETLFSLDPVRSVLEKAGAGPRGLEVFFSRLLRDGFALAAAGDYRPLRDVAAAAAAVAIPGARRVGLVTGWASRLEGTYSALFDPPDVTGSDLVAVAKGLLALPE